MYKPPPTIDESEEEQRIEESAGKVVSQVGFVESATPIAQQSERFRPKRAAVLICLFEGDGGDLRVVLTKRSSRLSTHSGWGKCNYILNLCVSVKNAIRYELGFGGRFMMIIVECMFWNFGQLTKWVLVF